jgi:hypothetical protein
VISRIGYDLVRATLRLAMALWPLWLFWFAWRGSNIAWRELLLTFHGGSDPGYLLAYRAWPSVALAGPVAIMVAALVAYTLLDRRTSSPVARLRPIPSTDRFELFYWSNAKGSWTTFGNIGRLNLMIESAHEIVENDPIFRIQRSQ